MRIDLTGDYAGLDIDVPDDVPDTDIVTIEAGIARYLIRRIQQAESRLELTQAQMLDRASELVMAAAMWAGR